MDEERKRLDETANRTKHWRRWGPYLSERQWGTVREDYSANGTAWDYLPHDHARSRAYRWGEDGILGISDNHQRLCFALAFWNGRDPILKERLFGLTGPEGSHGEDVKELYYFLDSTPTHSYMKALYKYPQGEFPYARLVAEGKRPRTAMEFELLDTGIFDQDRYFDIFVEYAKADVDDILIQVKVINRGPEAASLHLLPTLWFRNTWSWAPGTAKPALWRSSPETIDVDEPTLGRYQLWLEGAPPQLFTENETNTERLYGHPSGTRDYKDAFHRHIIGGDAEAVNAGQIGTKGCGWYQLELGPGEEHVVRMRLHALRQTQVAFDEVMTARREEADTFYAEQHCASLSAEGKNVQRQAYAGLLWTKQFYSYSVEDWLKGDPGQPTPPAGRRNGRNSDWKHLYNEDILSMPDTWEYPWFAAWDTAFHMIPFATIDPDFAKHQLGLFLREWYLHPNGQMPAYEWAFGDVNPPVHAWACWRVYKIDQKLAGKPDVAFLERVFHKLLMNFTWWVNRKDSAGNNIFEGGFLGLDNIGVFDRSKPLPTGGYLEQSDGTSWMAMYCLNMLRISLELATANPVYEDIASKFFEHFLYIANAMNRGDEDGLWDEEDGFYYDRLRVHERSMAVKIRSMVGLIPLFAVESLDTEVLNRLPGFRKRMEWFIHNRPDLAGNLASMTREGVGERRLLSLVGRERLRRLMQRMLDTGEFLSPYGIRSLSKYHEHSPYELPVNGDIHRVNYEPAESRTGMFGGNSNWRGPIWFPVNYLLIESLQKFHHYHGDAIQVDFPTGSGRQMNLGEVAAELSQRLARLFIPDANGRRPSYGGVEKLQTDPHFRDYPLFFEYFHGDNGAGLGASHQTGWTALVAKLLQQSGE
ncbi:MAG: glucosidase [Bryobacteraceae bacterium]|nr:glucosidase [Bryobacteraceae bacterium]